VRLSSQPAPVHFAIGREVIYAFYICQALPLFPCIVVIDSLHRCIDLLHMLSSALMWALWLVSHLKGWLNAVRPAVTMRRSAHMLMTALTGFMVCVTDLKLDMMGHVGHSIMPGQLDMCLVKVGSCDSFGVMSCCSSSARKGLMQHAIGMKHCLGLSVGWKTHSSLHVMTSLEEAPEHAAGIPVVLNSVDVIREVAGGSLGWRPEPLSYIGRLMLSFIVCCIIPCITDTKMRQKLLGQSLSTGVSMDILLTMNGLILASNATQMVLAYLPGAL